MVDQPITTPISGSILVFVKFFLTLTLTLTFDPDPELDKKHTVNIIGKFICLPHLICRILVSTLDVIVVLEEFLMKVALSRS